MAPQGSLWYSEGSLSKYIFYFLSRHGRKEQGSLGRQRKGKDYNSCQEVPWPSLENPVTVEKYEEILPAISLTDTNIIKLERKNHL